MKYLLIKYSVNIADEFDLSGFAVCSEDCWDNVKKDTESQFTKESPISLPFGNYEAIFADYEEWEDCFTVEELQLDESITLIRLFGNSSSQERFFENGFFHNGDFDVIFDVSSY